MAARGPHGGAALKPSPLGEVINHNEHRSLCVLSVRLPNITGHLYRFQVPKLPTGGPRFPKACCRIALTALQDAICGAWLGRWSQTARATGGHPPRVGEPDLPAKPDRLDS